MNSQMTQLFKVFLALVMVIIIGVTVSNYLTENFSTAEVSQEETAEDS